ncbi:BgTH12-02950 [Blumeria graminis f. sp. triticale]|uniref:BgTH12-02950 n=1 Tax=Blumeria graminis f. sp. triticale TaxID=1689686 RepID=A0A9W4D2U3_BLUGR|nr:BgTH12-02950 [Blumeria graminis f. sp. triticale]
MAKRKRNQINSNSTVVPSDNSSKKSKPLIDPIRKHDAAIAVSDLESHEQPIIFQLITGSYEKILHGVMATVTGSKVDFVDTFLFHAHTAAIRCLAVSPPTVGATQQAQKVLLASGGTDERINLYHLSAHAPKPSTKPSTILAPRVAENPLNRELGSLLHHSSAVTKLCFPNRSKLLSAAEDRQIAVIRTRDWSLLSSIKSPAPKQIGRPSGDTAPTGGAPSGVNDFAVHPSMKVMLSVGKGEKCLRLWNLVTGKKAGALKFDRDHLVQVGEERHSLGEGRRVVWGTTNAGDEFCVGFERGLLIYGMNSKPRCKVFPEPRTKLHQFSYVRVKGDDMLLAVSTEDGRVLFYSTKPADLQELAKDSKSAIPSAKPLAQLGGKAVDLSGRIKDFFCLWPEHESPRFCVIVTAGSDGALRLWQVQTSDFSEDADGPRQVGTLLGTYETSQRITCLAAFTMLPYNGTNPAEDNITALGVHDEISTEELTDSE